MQDRAIVTMADQ